MATENNEEAALSEDDAFAQAFGEAVAAVDGSGAKPEEKQEEKKDEPADASEDGSEEKKGAEEGEGGAQGDGKETVEGDRSGDEEKPAGSDDGKPAQQPVDDRKNDLAELTAAIKELVPPKPAAAEETKPDAKKPDPIPEPELYAFTEEEQKVLDSYAKEWDEHDRAWQIREKKLTHDITAVMSHKFTLALGQVLQQIEQGLAPVLQGHVESAQEKHFSAIRKEHSDFDQIKDEVGTWIKNQPKYLQPHLQKTYDEGATADVIELITSFKTATGRTQSQAPGTQSKGNAAPKKDVVPTHKAAELAPVDTKRTTVGATSSGTVDKNDFDAGFDEALAAIGMK